jgi:hypothetical protein
LASLKFSQILIELIGYGKNSTRHSIRLLKALAPGIRTQAAIERHITLLGAIWQHAILMERLRPSGIYDSSRRAMQPLFFAPSG